MAPTDPKNPADLTVAPVMPPRSVSRKSVNQACTTSCSTASTSVEAVSSLRAPRYTSYPTADRFTELFGSEEYTGHLRQRSSRDTSALSLYVHVPFCESLCYYCACNKVVTRKRDKGTRFLDALKREADLVLEQLGGQPVVRELHLGGGTPTWLTDQEIEQLFSMLTDRFAFQSGGEYSIEIDPRSVGNNTIEHLADLGFNRMSLGVQDIDHRVQVAINRVQPLAMTENIIERARATGFRSTNVDLVYGLPYQTRDRFKKTIDAITDLRPERIALFQYAHLPQSFKAQKRIDEKTLPSADERRGIATESRERLEAAGYIHIGLDHFAVPEDELAKAAQTGRLHRNFQGYCTQANRNLVALGPSAISQVGSCYSQNERGFEAWRARILKNELPVARGIELTRDDHIRRNIINALMCNGYLDIASVEIGWLIDFKTYFATELETLLHYQRIGIVTVTDEAIQLTAVGKENALRTVASAFDKALRTLPPRARYSVVS